MNHLTEEQFEDILQDKGQVPAHIDECAQCRARLAQKRALAQRLRKAFSSVQASCDLADRIRANVSAFSEHTAAAKARSRTVLLGVHRRFWSGLAAAAAILIVAIPVGLYLNTASQARGAQADLVRIHQANLDSLGGLFNHDDPGKLSEYFESQMGRSPAMICTGSGLSMCGCCVRQFQGEPVGSYVVKGRSRPVSVVVVRDSPKSLGMTPVRGQQDSERAMWRATCKGCNMASVQIGGESYCAVGQVTQEELAGVLGSLLE